MVDIAEIASSEDSLLCQVEQLKGQMEEITQIMDAMIERVKCFYQGGFRHPCAQESCNKIAVPPSQLLPGLVAAKLITPVPLILQVPNFENGQESYCEYHMGSAGYSTDQCFASSMLYKT